MKRKREATLEERATKLETELPHIYRELKEIHRRLDNDIPRKLEEIRASVDVVARKYGDLDAVSRFLSVCLKGLALLAGAILSVKHIMKSG